MGNQKQVKTYKKNEHNPETFVLCATTSEHLLVFHINSAVAFNQTKAWTQVAVGQRWPGNPELKKETRGTSPCTSGPNKLLLLNVLCNTMSKATFIWHIAHL